MEIENLQSDGIELRCYTEQPPLPDPGNDCPFPDPFNPLSVSWRSLTAEDKSLHMFLERPEVYIYMK
jgi:hypothetical protein